MSVWGLSLRSFSELTDTYTRPYRYSIALCDILVWVSAKTKTLVWEVVPGNSCGEQGSEGGTAGCDFQKCHPSNLSPHTGSSYSMLMTLPGEAGSALSAPQVQAGPGLSQPMEYKGSDSEISRHRVLKNEIPSTWSRPPALRPSFSLSLNSCT